THHHRFQAGSVKKLMVFEWRELLVLSDMLRKNRADFPNEQAVFRTAVSRAYYAAYGHASQVAAIKYSFMPSKTPDDHTQLRLHFRGRKMHALADKLDDLRKWRNKCDYDETADDVDDRMAANAISRADYVIKTLKLKP
ncbi:MAG: hypothetical protein ACREDR_49665, partial [Blastocatellia bacterium]